MAHSVVGIDIGSGALRAVEVRNPDKARPTVLRYHEVALNEGAVNGGEVLEPNSVAAALRQLWSSGGFKSKKVVLGMGNQRVLARDLSVPKMSLKQIRQSLEFEVQDLLPVPVSEALLDFYPVSESTTEHGPVVNGLLIAAVKSAVLGNVAATRLAGLTTVDVDLIPFAVSRVLVTRPGVPGVVAVIDLGANTTSVVITKAGVPQFVRIIPSGGDDVTQALIAGLETDAVDAEATKRRIGLTQRSAETAATREQWASPGEKAADIISEITLEQLGSLRNTLNYFATTRPGESIAGIFLSGGGAQLHGLPKALAEMTRLPVQGGDPFSTVGLASVIDGEQLRLSSSSYTVALGLALGRAA